MAPGYRHLCITPANVIQVVKPNIGTVQGPQTEQCQNLATTIVDRSWEIQQQDQRQQRQQQQQQQHNDVLLTERMGLPLIGSTEEDADMAAMMQGLDR